MDFNLRCIGVDGLENMHQPRRIDVVAPVVDESLGDPAVAQRLVRRPIARLDDVRVDPHRPAKRRILCHRFTKGPEQ